MRIPDKAKLTTVTALALVVVSAALVSAAEMETTNTPAEPFRGAYMMQIDGTAVGAVASLDGCVTAGEVVEETMGSDGVVRKHTGGMSVPECELKVGLNMGRPFWEWIRAALSRNYARHTVVLDPLAGPHRLELQNTLFTGLRIPPLSTARGGEVFLTFEFTPESVKVGPRGAVPNRATVVPIDPGASRLTIDGVAAGPSGLDELRIEQKIVEDAIGEYRDSQVEPAAMRYGDLRPRIPEGSARTLADLRSWHTSFLIQGNNGSEQERTGTLRLSSADGTAALTLSFEGLGVAALDPNPRVDGTYGSRIYQERTTLTSYPGS